MFFGKPKYVRNKNERSIPNLYTVVTLAVGKFFTIRCTDNERISFSGKQVRLNLVELLLPEVREAHQDHQDYLHV